jgi:hypothetical protein
MATPNLAGIQNEDLAMRSILPYILDRFTPRIFKSAIAQAIKPGQFGCFYHDHFQ